MKAFRYCISGGDITLLSCGAHGKQAAGVASIAVLEGSPSLGYPLDPERSDSELDVQLLRVRKLHVLLGC